MANTVFERYIKDIDSLGVDPNNSKNTSNRRRETYGWYIIFVKEHTARILREFMIHKNTNQ